MKSNHYPTRRHARIAKCLFGFLAALFFFPAACAAALNLSAMYDAGRLERRRAEFERNNRSNYENVILPALTAEERKALRGVRIVVPVYSELKSPGPFDFYAGDGAVHLPALSLQFLEDLTVALAWLQTHQYATDPVFHYVGMLKYQGDEGFPDRRPLPPLEALGVPADARRDKLVDELAFKIRASAIVWLLSHELGHVRFAHPGYAEGPDARRRARQNEADADRFAVDLMRRLNILPSGAAAVLHAMVVWSPNRGDFADDAEWERFLDQEATHPFTADRLRGLADAVLAGKADFAKGLNNPRRADAVLGGLARDITTIAQILDDPKIQRMMVAMSQAMDVAALAPRRPDALPSVDDDGAREAGGGGGGAAPAPAAVYRGKHVRKLRQGGTEELDLVLTLRRDGDNVAGRFSFGVGVGTFQGKSDGKVCDVAWKRGDQAGRGSLTLSEDGRSFEGAWGFLDSRDDGGTWSGRRAY